MFSYNYIALTSAKWRLYNQNCRGDHLKRTMKHKKDDNYGTVYSTGQGRLCPACGKSPAHCTCRSTKPAVQGDGIVRVGRETKGRRGKAVTVITGVPLDHVRLLKLAQELKQKCGSGGTVKDSVIEKVLHHHILHDIYCNPYKRPRGILRYSPFQLVPFSSPKASTNFLALSEYT